MIDLSNITLISVRQPCADTKIAEIELKLFKKFPKQYVMFLNQSDGFESDIVRLYSISEIEERNVTYEVDKYCPDFINIGDDGGGSAIMLKNSFFLDNKVYLVGHGVMTPAFMEVIGDDFCSWLADGCPLDALN